MTCPNFDAMAFQSAISNRDNLNALSDAPEQIAELRATEVNERKF